MLKKLLSNLPFNPSLLPQVSFYAKRLKAEAALRRAGFLFVALSLVVQTFAALYPAEKSLAASPNHVLNGITTKASILQAWDNNTGNIQNIYGKFGITRKNIFDIPGQQPNTEITSTSRNWWSTGRLPLTSFGISSQQWGERAIDVGNLTIYERPLRAWDHSNNKSRYAAFHGKNSYGVDFWILQNCGNPTFVGPYLPKEPKPKLAVHKTLLTSLAVKPGDTVRYRLEYQNTVPQSLATNFRLTDNLDSRLEFLSLSNISGRSGNTVYISRGGQLGYSATPYTATLVAKVKNSAANHAVICNSASVSSTQSSATSPERPCVTVIIKCNVPGKQNLDASDSNCKPTPTPTPTLEPQPAGYCIASTVFQSGSNRIFNVHTEAYLQGPAKIEGYDYDIGADGSIEYRDKIAPSPNG